MPKPFSPDMPTADAYVLLFSLALAQIQYPHDIRMWWREERRYWRKYGLTDSHEQEIIDLCRNRVAEIEADAERYAVI